MMSQNTEDVLMTDVQDKSSDAKTTRFPTKRPSPPTPSGHEEPQETERSKYPCSKAAENIDGELENQLSEAREGAKDFEHRFNEARDLNTNLQVAFTISQNESIELKKKIKTLQNESTELKKKYKTLQNGHDVIHEQRTAQLLSDVEGRRKQADSNTQIALLKVQELSEELQKCKDELFNLQPPNPVADTHISAEWDALCSSITTWIDDQSGGVEDLRTRFRELNSNKKCSKALAKYWGEDRQLIANHYSQSSNILDEILRYNIHCFLEAEVFDDRVYMVGLSTSEAKLLLKIEREMAKLEPRRDPSYIGLWRSEALAALSSTAGFSTFLEKDTQKIRQEASEILEPLLQRRARGAMSAFDRDIIMPAIRLASTLRQSTAKYHFVFRVVSNKHEEKPPALQKPGNRLLLYKSDLEDIDVLDVGSRITLKKGRNYEEASDGSIAESILVVHPALYRETPTERILVSRQLVLAKLLKPPQRRGQARDVEENRGWFDKLGLKFTS
ncbi:hypothetical protein HO133_009130 [Letharia lupina]|uniref:Uncharacterized protein n=1 Tax=Letharia lupina TaxID=560253 RepID=A0A8H6FFT0_9LECA|nr:uncharacterized protein HO133_009130 [Letharia lupina]KAF6226264.1 hypothetical protein HO133_009130 [Letharia lupina]